MKEIQFALIQPGGPPPPMMSTTLRGYVVRTHDNMEGQFRYVTEVFFMDPFNGDFQSVWPGFFHAETFLGAVDKHHRIVVSLKLRRGAFYRRVAKQAPLAEDFSMDALFGVRRRKKKASA